MKKLFRRLLLLTLLPLSVGIWAQVYTWVDDNGKTHYSDKKPSGDVEAKVEQVGEGDLKDLNVIDSKASKVNVDQMSRDRQRRQSEDEQKAEQQNLKAAQAWKSKNCSIQTENIRQGKAGGGTRIVGTKEVKRCSVAIPAAYQPFLSDYIVQ